MIAPKRAGRIGLRLRRIAIEPALHVVVIALLAPEQASEGLALDQARVVGQSGAGALRVKFVGFFLCGR